MAPRLLLARNLLQRVLPTLRTRYCPPPIQPLRRGLLLDTLILPRLGDLSLLPRRLYIYRPRARGIPGTPGQDY